MAVKNVYLTYNKPKRHKGESHLFGLLLYPNVAAHTCVPMALLCSSHAPVPGHSLLGSVQVAFNSLGKGAVKWANMHQ